MKPFDLEKAKTGAPVCLKNGTPVKILTFDRKSQYPIVALAKSSNEEEALMSFTNTGHFRKNVNDSKFDLVMCTVKTQGWTNVYSGTDASHQAKNSNMYLRELDMGIYKTKDAAEREGRKELDYLVTIPIEWEE